MKTSGSIFPVVTAFTLVAITGASSTHGMSQPDGQEKVADERRDWLLKTSKDAITQALGIFGISAAASQGVEARVIILDEDKTPFLHKQITKRPLWRISVHKYRLRLKSAATDENDLYERTFDLFLDPRDGKLLKIISRWPQGVPESAPEPRAAFAEQCFRDSGREKYHSFPDTPPKINFLNALNAVNASGAIGCNPLIAKQIVAHYVIRSKMGREPQPVWAITLRGIAPFEAAYPGVPVAARDHMRHIIDARTGKWLGAGTSPQPEEPVVQSGEAKSVGREGEDAPGSNSP